MFSFHKKYKCALVTLQLIVSAHIFDTLRDANKWSQFGGCSECSGKANKNAYQIISRPPNKQSGIQEVLLLLQTVILLLFPQTCFFSTSQNLENILQLKCHSDTPVLKL